MSDKESLTTEKALKIYRENRKAHNSLQNWLSSIFSWGTIPGILVSGVTTAVSFVSGAIPLGLLFAGLTAGLYYAGNYFYTKKFETNKEVFKIEKWEKMEQTNSKNNENSVTTTSSFTATLLRGASYLLSLPAGISFFATSVFAPFFILSPTPALTAFAGFAVGSSVLTLAMSAVSGLLDKVSLFNKIGEEKFNAIEADYKTKIENIRLTRQDLKHKAYDLWLSEEKVEDYIDVSENNETNNTKSDNVKDNDVKKIRIGNDVTENDINKSDNNLKNSKSIKVKIFDLVQPKTALTQNNYSKLKQ